MPFEITVDADGALKQLDEIARRLADLEQQTSNTFLVWQRDDLHRHFPKVEGSGLSVSTTIYPRSRLRRDKPEARKSVRRRARIAAGRPGGHHRPILRPELFQQLRDRMVEMCGEAMTWL
jgi:hypothetical protein